MISTWVVSKFVKYVKIRWFCVEKVRIEALKGKIFNFNENNENHKLYCSRCLREQVKLLQWRKGNWDNEYCIEFPCLMKSTPEHYGLLQTRLFHSARWSGWLSAPQCSTIMVKFYEKLWLLKKITNYWHLKFVLLIAPKRGWHLCISFALVDQSFWSFNIMILTRE
jgi:hypothetical protein